MRPRRRSLSALASNKFESLRLSLRLLSILNIAFGVFRIGESQNRISEEFGFIFIRWAVRIANATQLLYQNRGGLSIHLLDRLHALDELDELARCDVGLDEIAVGAGLHSGTGFIVLVKVRQHDDTAFRNLIIVIRA